MACRFTAQPGERIVNHYSFYTAFWPSEEFNVIHGEVVLGSLPVSQPVAEKSLALFGGRRWRVVRVDGEKVIVVVPAHAGRAPNSLDVQDACIGVCMRRCIASIQVQKFLSFWITVLYPLKPRTRAVRAIRSRRRPESLGTTV
jgi:hypothetical protein